MTWNIKYIDVPVGDVFGEVENRCIQGWEPFSVTEHDFYEVGKPPLPMYRFWLKRRMPDEPSDAVKEAWRILDDRKKAEGKKVYGVHPDTGELVDLTNKSQQ